MNIVFLIGEVVNDIDIKFIYDRHKKSLGKLNISISLIELKLLDKQVVKLHAYNEIADFVYRSLKKGDSVLVKGNFTNDFVKVNGIYMLT